MPHNPTSKMHGSAWMLSRVGRGRVRVDVPGPPLNPPPGVLLCDWENQSPVIGAANGAWWFWNERTAQWCAGCPGWSVYISDPAQWMRRWGHVLAHLPAPATLA